MRWENDACHSSEKSRVSNERRLGQPSISHMTAGKPSFLETWDFNAAFEPRLTAPPVNRERWASSFHLHRPMHKPVRQSFRSKRRTAQGNRPTSHRAARLRNSSVAADLSSALPI